EPLQGLSVGHCLIPYPTAVLQVSVFGPDPRIVEARGHAVGWLDLPVGVLEEVTQAAVEYTRLPAPQRRRMMTALEPLPGCFHPDERHVRVGEKHREDAHRVRAAPDAGDPGARQLAPALPRLSPCLAADTRLEIAHEPR